MKARKMEQKGFVETDISTRLGSITLEICYTLNVEDGEYRLDIGAVTNAHGDDFSNLYCDDVLADEVYECLGITH